jgi:Helix-turn-helix
MIEIVAAADGGRVAQNPDRAVLCYFDTANFEPGSFGTPNCLRHVSLPKRAATAGRDGMSRGGHLMFFRAFAPSHTLSAQSQFP